MPHSTGHPMLELGRRWVTAEQRGDVAALEQLTTEDFTLVGPLGFILGKPQWLDRYRTGALLTRHLTWADVEVRDYGDAAVAVGIHTQQATYQGRPVDGSFRSTHIAIHRQRQWFLAGIHLSSLGAPAGPGTTGPASHPTAADPTSPRSTAADPGRADR